MFQIFGTFQVFNNTYCELFGNFTCKQFLIALGNVSSKLFCGRPNWKFRNILNTEQSTKQVRTFQNTFWNVSKTYECSGTFWNVSKTSIPRALLHFNQSVKSFAVCLPFVTRPPVLPFVDRPSILCFPQKAH